MSNETKETKDAKPTKREPFGWFDFAKVYDRIAAEMPEGGRFVEIGVLQGKSLLYIAKKLLPINATAVGVDVFGTKTTWETNNVPDKIVSKAWVEDMLRAEKVKNFELIEADSAEAATRFKDESIDAVFIDGCHNYEWVTKDLENYYPKVKTGGIVAGHDYAEGSDVQRALDAFCKKYGLSYEVYFNFEIGKIGTFFLYKK